MKLILDTCAIIYALTGDDRLPISQYNRLLNPDNQIFICEESIREIAVKKRISKSTVSISLDEVAKVIDLIGIQVIPYSLELYDKFISLPIKADHKDPSDAMIISQALIFDAVLMTSDKKFEQYKSLGLKLIMLK